MKRHAVGLITVVALLAVACLVYWLYTHLRPHTYISDNEILSAIRTQLPFGSSPQQAVTLSNSFAARQEVRVSKLACEEVDTGRLTFRNGTLSGSKCVFTRVRISSDRPLDLVTCDTFVLFFYNEMDRLVGYCLSHQCEGM